MRLNEKWAPEDTTRNLFYQATIIDPLLGGTVYELKNIINLARYLKVKTWNKLRNVVGSIFISVKTQLDLSILLLAVCYFSTKTIHTALVEYNVAINFLNDSIKLTLDASVCRLEEITRKLGQKFPICSFLGHVVFSFCILY